MTEGAAGTTRPVEPIYADPYTRIAWLHGEIDRLQDALTLISEITESPDDKVVRVQLHNAQRLAKEALDV